MRPEEGQPARAETTLDVTSERKTNTQRSNNVFVRTGRLRCNIEIQGGPVAHAGYRDWGRGQ